MSRHFNRFLALVAVAGFAARAATAQGMPAPAASCPVPLEPTGSFSADTLTLSVDPGYGIKPVDSTSALTALSVIGDALVLPAPLPMPPVIVSTYGTGSGTADSPPVVTGGLQGFMGEAFVEIERSAKVKRVALSQTTLVNSLDAALVEAVKKAAEEGAFMAYQEAAKGKGGFVFVLLRTMPTPHFKEKAEDYKRPESLGLVPTPNLTPATKKRGELVSLPIRALRVPIVRLTGALTVTKRGPDPAFPISELRGRQDGFVNIEFVVGPDGGVIPGTLRVANAMTADYATAVINSLKDYRFRPAMAGACPVAARMAYTFTFNVN